MFKYLFGPAGTALQLPQMYSAMQTKDRNAYPPRTGGRAQRELIKQEMDERYGSRPPEPAWMNSWGAVGNNTADVAKKIWDEMQASNAAQAARSAPPAATPEAAPAPGPASVPLPTARPQMGVPMPQPRPAIPQDPSGLGQRPFRDLPAPVPRGFAPPESRVPLQAPSPEGASPDFWSQLRSILAANGDAAIRMQS